MEIRNLITFVNVCEFMSFSRAAKELGYTQSTVTQQIQQLEAEFGVQLFERAGKTFSLSAKGRELLPYANRIAAMAAETKQVVSDTQSPSGSLRVAVIETTGNYVLPRILEAYMKAFPQVHLSVWTATTLEIMGMLRKSKVDLLLLLDERVVDPAWETAWERPDEVVFLCNKDHPFAGRDDVLLEEMLKENLLLTEKGCNYREVFDRDCQARNLTVRSTLEIGSTGNILSLVRSNLGITFLPAFTAQEELARGNIASFRLRDYSMQMLIQLIYRKDKWLSPAMREFIRLCKELG